MLNVLFARCLRVGIRGGGSWGGRGASFMSFRSRPSLPLPLRVLTDKLGWLLQKGPARAQDGRSCCLVRYPVRERRRRVVFGARIDRAPLLHKNECPPFWPGPPSGVFVYPVSCFVPLFLATNSTHASPNWSSISVDFPSLKQVLGRRSVQGVRVPARHRTRHTPPLHRPLLPPSSEHHHRRRRPPFPSSGPRVDGATGALFPQRSQPIGNGGVSQPHRTRLAPRIARTRFPVNLSIRQEVPRHLDGFGDGAGMGWPSRRRRSFVTCCW